MNLLRYTVLKDLGSRILLNRFRRVWRRNNRHNETLPMNRFPAECVRVGKHTYGELNITTFSDQTKLLIGSFVSISQNVRFLLDVEHHTDHVSTFPFHVKVLNDCKSEAFSKGNIVVEDDVWIGFGATILSGVTIGRGSVIAAGAVVTKDVPPYAIAGGAPAKVLRYRFPKEHCERLKKIDYANLDDDTIRAQIDLLYEKVDESNIDALEACFATKPEWRS